MTSPAGLGAKRAVVGAHYGLMDWIVQRVSAVVMIVYTVVLLVAFLFGQDFSYVGWSGLFAGEWMKIITFVTLLALFYHVWVGMRDIWMDYVKSVGLRLTLQIATLLWLIGCAGYAAQIIWRT